MKRFRLLICTFLAFQQISPLKANDEIEKKEQIQADSRNLMYTGLAAVCLVGAMFTSKLFVDLVKASDAMNEAQTAAGIAIAADALNNYTPFTHYQRWQRWYGNKVNMGKSIEMFGLGVITVCLAFAGPYFLSLNKKLNILDKND